FARTGRLGDYYFIAHWFPKIGVLEDDGWNCHQFHAATEFFADFGVYDVSLTVPAGWIVGATGRAVSRTDAAGTTTHRFQQADVHDFAWTTSPRFVETTAKFEEPGLPPVDIRLLMQPEHTDQIERHLAATRAALKYYGTWFGAYPYGHLTVVDPVAVVNPDAQGEGTDGMEYPTLVSAGTRYFPPPRSLDPEDVVVHEVGHQFWYGVVATNEFEDAWMDEGLTTYSTARVLAEAFPNGFTATRTYFGGLVTWPFDDSPWSRDVDGNRLTGFRRVASWEVPSRPSWQYWPGTAGATTYNKTALWLATLERHLGWPTMQKILATYYARGAFRHPTPDEFFAIANDVSGRDLTWFFDAVYRGSASFDYGVAQVINQPSGTRGFTGDGDDRRYGPGGGTDAVDSVVVVRRYGEGVFPIDVRVTFADGGTITEAWDGRARWQTFTYRRGTAVTAVDVDPDRVLMLDVNATNNSWTSAPAARLAARRWSLRWLTWLEELLLTHAFFV
ncbi:MAG TPA: M1 family metallopeptidase, partial [Vicinamibacterales bacterium]|nr:M1 family metallopeptidase [Vicinamibacterales bacterium]